MFKIVSPLKGLSGPVSRLKVRVLNFVLFVPLGSDRLITSDGDVFKVKG